MILRYFFQNIKRATNNGFFGEIYPGQIVESNDQSELVILVDQNTINGFSEVPN